ncbi:5-oxoprolinase subunit PxpB [Pedobacter africanus]|uniref:Inhibitor of KinA n=1 Tax=Pedobacter africanus TaxID=151894 RepID=A0A1W1ZU54_9SPHI|nr:5-oxoprolinase subunit PxpB [Pedobacter africanus]SMC51999.1 inhibitor of KinA [Pedobacter africanus]
MSLTQQNLVQYYPLGDSAVVMQFGDVISKTINLQVRAVAAWLDEYTFEGFVEYVPAFTSITIYYEPWLLKYDEIVLLLQEMTGAIDDTEMQEQSAVRIIPVHYGGAMGPDLEYVANYHHISMDEVIALHTQPEYLVYMIGFAPGFPYLGGMDERIATPRKENPRPKIPRGAVGIAGSQTGVYPMETPGGWQLIGQTPLELFDIGKEEPALLKAGDRVRFSPVTAAEWLKIKSEGDGN